MNGDWIDTSTYSKFGDREKATQTLLLDNLTRSIITNTEALQQKEIEKKVDKWEHTSI